MITGVGPTAMMMSNQCRYVAAIAHDHEMAGQAGGAGRVS
jgi:hypothetical protein